MHRLFWAAKNGLLLKMDCCKKATKYFLDKTKIAYLFSTMKLIRSKFLNIFKAGCLFFVIFFNGIKRLLPRYELHFYQM